MKLIPMPENGDRVILKEIPPLMDQPSVPEAEGKVVIDDDTIYNLQENNWQLAVKIEGEEAFTTYAKWDDEAKAWRD